MYDPSQPVQLVIGSREWWLARLGKRLDDRQIRMSQLEDYYAGRQPLAFVSDTFKAAFGDRFRIFSANFMSLVVDTHRQRLQVQGIRIGDHSTGSTDAWDWWQRNRLDAESQTAFTESLVKGIVYILVWPNAQGEPEASIESPLQVVVETTPGQSWKRRAALKRWLGDDGKYHAELYLPGGIYKYISAQSGADFTLSNWASVAQWSPELVRGEPWPLKNPLGVIPIVPLVNRPRLNGTNPVGLYQTIRVPAGAMLPDDGQSEIAAVMSNQDTINKLRADMINASDLAAFRQRWLRNWQVEVDEKTGQPIEPFRAAVDRLWILPPPDPAEDPNMPEPEFGEFSETDLAPMIAGIQAEIQQLGAISQTPYHYLLPQSGQPPSGESLKSAETGLVAKVKDSQLYKGEGLEEVFRLNFAFRGDKRADDMGAEIMWVNTESRSEGVHTDALVKQKTAGVPDEVLWEGFGYSEREIARIKAIIAVMPPEPAPTIVSEVVPSGIPGQAVAPVAAKPPIAASPAAAPSSNIPLK
jgi:hypothetical protein